VFVADELSLRLAPDELRALAEPLVPKFRSNPQGGTAPLDDRAVFTAIVYVLTSGCDGGICRRRSGCRSSPRTAGWANQPGRDWTSAIIDAPSVRAKKGAR
jgi:transposase